MSQRCGGPACDERVDPPRTYCSARCNRRAKALRTRLRKQGFVCPACGQPGIPHNTMAGAVCANCVPYPAVLCGKLAYGSQAAAEWATRGMQVRRDNGEEHLKALRAYCCPNCCDWHLTSQPLRERRR